MSDQQNEGEILVGKISGVTTSPNAPSLQGMSSRRTQALAVNGSNTRLDNDKEISSDFPPFCTPKEEEADERLWAEQFAATPIEKLNTLVDIVQSKIRVGKTSPLDFTKK